MYDVITVGSATVDVFAKTKCDLVTFTSSTKEEEFIAYPCGSKILVDNLSFHIGGGGTNTAVAFSRLGMRTAYLGNIGRDVNGRNVLELLKREGIDFVGTISEDMTNYSIILDSIKDDRTILAYKDASEKLKLKNLDKDRIFARWIYFCAMDVKILEKLVILAEKRRIKIAFNPSNYLAEKGKKHLRTILKKTDLLILNDEEAKLLVGTCPEHVMLDKLKKLGPKTIVMTQGEKGATVYHSDTIYHADAPKVKVKETTGAGDAFGASFLSGLLLRNSVKFGLKLGIVNATNVITHYGAKNRLLTLKEAESLINKYKVQVKTVNLKK
ncbi:carbohydrate kinase family protein [Candidatus Woesearchaeota archaeon]|nr:carbohydrate kinase family protein [Candidatus Woesearchaeota archaeon]